MAKEILKEYEPISYDKQDLRSTEEKVLSKMKYLVGRILDVIGSVDNWVSKGAKNGEKAHMCLDELLETMKKYGFGTNAEGTVNESRNGKNMKKNIVKLNEDELRSIIKNAICERMKFTRFTDPDNPKKNVGPKDENINFFVTVGSGTSRKIYGDKGFKSREAAERVVKRLRDQGVDTVKIISKKATNESSVSNTTINESQLREIVAESVKKVLNNEYDGNYLQLVKEEMHRLFELSWKVPEHIRPEIYGMATSLESILEEAKRNDEFDNWNN